MTGSSGVGALERPYGRSVFFFSYNPTTPFDPLLNDANILGSLPDYLRVDPWYWDMESWWIQPQLLTLSYSRILSI